MMPHLYLANAFSLQMLPFVAMYTNKNINIRMIPVHEVRQMIKVQYKDLYNVIGHKDLNNIVTDQLGFDLPSPERRSITLSHFDTLIVAQYMGPRLPEGSTALPEDAEIIWLVITMLSDDNHMLG